jgi:hypothetical protein
MNMEYPTEGAIKEALNHANGYVYVIDAAYEGKDDVPPDAIVGAWKENSRGIIEGDFIYNNNYKLR